MNQIEPQSETDQGLVKPENVKGEQRDDETEMDQDSFNSSPSMPPCLDNQNTTTTANQKMYLCRYCDFHTSCKQTKKTHERAHKRCYCCPLCRAKFTDLWEFRIHRKAHGDNVWIKCESCDFQSKTLRGLELHARVHSEAREYPVECPICSVRFKRFIDLKQHTKKKHKPKKGRKPKVKREKIKVLNASVNVPSKSSC